jgi:hypothetical protein
MPQAVKKSGDDNDVFISDNASGDKIKWYYGQKRYNLLKKNDVLNQIIFGYIFEKFYQIRIQGRPV